MTFEEGGQSDRSALRRRQQAQTGVSTKAGKLGLPLVEAKKRMVASIGRRVGILPEILADLTDPWGERVENE